MHAYAAGMTSHGNGHLIYLAATAGQGEQLEVCHLWIATNGLVMLSCSDVPVLRLITCHSQFILQGVCSTSAPTTCAANSDYVLPLQALLQDLLPVAEQPQDAYGSQQDTDKGTHPTMADYLEFVDKQTGLTPLLAAVFHHREACAKLVSCSAAQ